VSEIPRLLQSAAQGDPEAASRLLPLVYNELRRLAAHRLAAEAPGQTLQPTALVHEAYLRLVGGGQRWDGRGHFFAAAAEAMRRILVENARRKKRAKHGGGRQRVDLEALDLPADTTPDELLALDEALARLGGEDPAAAEVVKLHFFAGLPMDETAAALGMSRATAYRHWTYAKAWLHAAVRGGSSDSAR
jgi:RNA polymerase sigma factor (TIGR02999 family)